MIFQKKLNIHFVGIGGSGMSGIAEIFKGLGHNVSGSDLLNSDIIEYLRKIDIKVYIGHNEKNIEFADIVVVSNAIKKNNPEILVAIKKNVPIFSRVEALVELTKSKYVIAIYGTHGKTTTTSFISLVLYECGLDPTIVVGGVHKNFNTNARIGNSKYIIVEADESDGSFLKILPNIAVITNIDNDHLDYYGNMKNFKDFFLKYINHIHNCNNATTIVSLDDKITKELISKINKKCITYGITANADIKASNIRLIKNYTNFDVIYKNTNIGTICMKSYGEHNVSNSLAAISVGLQLDLPFNLIAKSISKFKGVVRRFELKGEKNGIMFIDDYAHHPTEIIATLKTVKHLWPKRRIVVLFQPHRYTRTRDLFNEFGTSFFNANIIEVLDIYPAGERPIIGITSDLILNSLVNNNCNAKKFIDLKKILQYITVNDIVLTLGAGDVWKIGEELLKMI